MGCGHARLLFCYCFNYEFHFAIANVGYFLLKGFQFSSVEVSLSPFTASMALNTLSSVHFLMWELLSFVAIPTVQTATVVSFFFTHAV